MENDLRDEIKRLIIETLELDEISPEDIIDDEPLFIDGLGLDSIDALELGMALKKKYSLSMDSNKERNKEHFASINTLAEFVRKNRHDS